MITNFDLSSSEVFFNHDDCMGLIPHHLNGKDLDAFAQVSRKSLIMAISVKEILLNGAFNKIILENFTPEVLKLAIHRMVEANKLPGSSLEKINAIRNAIISIYQGMGPVTIGREIDIGLTDIDYTLQKRMFSVMDPDNKSVSVIGGLGKNFSASRVKALFGALKDNIIKLDSLHFECYSKIEGSWIISLIANAIRSTKSLSKIDLHIKNWDRSGLIEILKAIDENNSIKSFLISDTDMAQPLALDKSMLNLNKYDCGEDTFLGAVAIKGSLK